MTTSFLPSSVRPGWRSLAAVAALGLVTGAGAGYLGSWRAAHSGENAASRSMAATTETSPGVSVPVPGETGVPGKRAATSISQEALLDLASKDPAGFLDRLPGLTVAVNEAGKGTQEEVAAWLGPALSAALEGLWEISPERAFEALKKLNECGEHVWTAGAVDLVDRLSARGDPAEVAALVLKYAGINYGTRFAGHWGRRDPEGALAWSMGRGALASTSVRETVGEWAKVDPVAAQRGIMTIANERLRNSAMNALIKVLPKNGAALTPVVESILGQWETPGATSALANALAAWEKNDPVSLAAWMDKQGDEPYREALLKARAEAALSSVSANPEHATAALSELVSPAAREQAIFNGVRRLFDGNDNPVAAWAELRKLDDPELRVESYGALMRQMTNLRPQEVLRAAAGAATRDPDAMLAAIRDTNAHEPGMLRAAWTDEAVRAALAKTDPAGAEKIIEALNSAAAPQPSSR